MIFRVLWNQFGGLGKGCESERVRLIELDFGPNTLGTKQSWKNPKQIEQSYQIIFRLWARKARNRVHLRLAIFIFFKILVWLTDTGLCGALRVIRILALEFLSKNEKRCRKRRGAKCPRRDTQFCGELFFSVLYRLIWKSGSIRSQNSESKLARVQ